MASGRVYNLHEAGFSDAGSDWFYGASLLPSDAFDWEDAAHEPPDFKFLQSRWKRESRAGRKFHNIDLGGVLKTKFVGVYSNNMPSADGVWKHSEDRPNLRIDPDAEMRLQGVRRSADEPNLLRKHNDLLDKKKELDRLFGEFKPKYYELPDDFDEPWVRHR